MEKLYRQSMPWEAYPTGTKVYAVLGGHWEKTERGWKWCTGATFPTPGADWHMSATRRKRKGGRL